MKPNTLQRINYVIGSVIVNGHTMKILKPTTAWGEPRILPKDTRILPKDNPYLV
jgi:hypothetical protein